MGILSKIFTWWDGATIGTLVNSAMTGVQVGTDSQGNRYYRSKKPNARGQERRWVIYDGANDASRVPSEWHGWLHGAFDDVPESRLPPPKIWKWNTRPMPRGQRRPIVRRALWSAEAGVLPPRAITKPGRPKPDDASGACPAACAGAGRVQFGRRA